MATIGGLLLFGSNPNRFLPQAGITATAYPSTTKNYDTVDEEDIRGSILPQISSKGKMSLKIKFCPHDFLIKVSYLSLVFTAALYLTSQFGCASHSKQARKTDAEPIPPSLLLRVALPEEAGFSADSLRKIDTLMQQAVADSVFPGASLLIAKNGMIVHHKSYGRMGYGEFAQPVPFDAIYDLASVTKVIATTTAAMLLVDRGRLDLDATVQSYLPEFIGEGKDRITVRHFLVHNSGLPPYKRYFLESTRPDEIIARILAEPLEYAPGAATRYSDLGVILTGTIIEKISGQPLDVFCKQNIFELLGMQETFFNPPEMYWPRIPPTEDDPWRGRMVHGVVHDENAFALGGVAGHAGLFSTARDLAILLQMLLNSGEYNGVKLLSREVIEKFIRRQNLTEGSTRALGWDTRSEENSSSGHLMSKRAFGHTGFTGNSVWVDPEKNLFVILLSNRVHPTRENRKIYRFRPVLHDAVLRGMIEY